MTRTAIQLYSIKELMAEDPLKTLSHVAAIGYQSVEFAGFFNIPAEAMRQHLDHLQLQACGSHTGLDQLLHAMDETLAYNEIIGNTNIVVPGLPQDMRNSRDAWIKTAQLFNRLGSQLRDRGFTFAYHNHAFEFDLHDGVSGYDILLDNMDPDMVKLQADIGWVAFAGNDPMAFMDRVAPHLLNIHAKQFKNLTSDDGTELGRGCIDYAPILQQARTLALPDVIMEQESYDMDMLDSIRISCDYMKRFL